MYRIFDKAVFIRHIWIFTALAGFILGVLMERNTSDAGWYKAKVGAYEETYQQKSGASAKYGNYELRTFDAGGNWYAVKSATPGGVKILGEADQIFPGLLAELVAWDRLVEYAKKHGPFKLDGPLTPEQEKILKDAGIRVEMHPDEEKR